MKAVLCWGVSATFAVKTGDLSRTPSSSWTLISLLTDLINSRSWQLSHFYHLSLFYGLISETSSSFTLYVLINIPPSLFSTLFFFIYTLTRLTHIRSHTQPRQSNDSSCFYCICVEHLRWIKHKNPCGISLLFDLTASLTLSHPAPARTASVLTLNCAV